MKYNITLRDKEGSRINTEIPLSLEDENNNPSYIEFTTQEMGYLYQILFPTADITVEASKYNSISDTWMVLYSYYHSEKRFVTHE